MVGQKQGTLLLTDLDAPAPKEEKEEDIICEDEQIHKLIQTVGFALGDIDRRLSMLEYKVMNLEQRGNRA